MPQVAATPLPDLQGFGTQLDALLAQGDPKVVRDAVMTLVEQMTHTNHQLAARLQAALRQLYRKKSEKVSAEQLALFRTRCAGPVLPVGGVMSHVGGHDGDGAEVERASSRVA